MSKIKIRKTQRGFAIGRFKDASGVECSIQESSWASEDAIWLGCDDADPKYFVPHGNPSWRKLEVPESAVFNTRMRLTREHVAALLPLLQHFVKTGEIPK